VSARAKSAAPRWSRPSVNAARIAGIRWAAPTRDNVQPRCRGGTTLNGRNKAIVCDRCNTDKGGRSLESWLYHLRKSGDQRAEIAALIVTLQ